MYFSLLYIGTQERSISIVAACGKSFQLRQRNAGSSISFFKDIHGRTDADAETIAALI